jgi:hypothetical protein
MSRPDANTVRSKVLIKIFTVLCKQTTMHSTIVKCGHEIFELSMMYNKHEYHTAFKLFNVQLKRWRGKQHFYFGNKNI